MTYQNIASIELTGSASVIQIADIPDTYDHLELYWSFGGGTADHGFPVQLTFNNVSTAGSYSWDAARQTDSNGGETESTSDTKIDLTYGSGGTYGFLFIPNYSDSINHLVCYSASSGTAERTQARGAAGSNSSLTLTTNPQYTLTSLELLSTFQAGDKIDLYAF